MVSYVWSDEVIRAVALALDYAAMSQAALAYLESMPPGAMMVCGPITTGGLGSIELNLAKLGETARRLRDQGENIFDQTPFEPALARIKLATPDQDDSRILEEFYGPLFRSGKITCLCFLPDWQTSVGASWEHDQAQALGLKIEYLRET